MRRGGQRTGRLRRQQGRATSRWSTSPGWPSTFPAPARSHLHDRRPGHWHPAADVSGRPRLHGVRALRRPGRRTRPHHVQLLGRLRRDVEPAARDQPGPSADVNDDGVANDAGRDAAPGELRNRSCGQTGFNPNADINNDCNVDVARPDLRQLAASASPVPKQPRLSQGATLAIDPADRRAADRLAAVQGRRSARRDRHGSLDRRRRDGSPRRRRRHAQPVRSGHDDDVVPDQRVPDDGVRRRRAAPIWRGRREAIAAQRPDPAIGDARIVMSTSTNGTTWSTPARRRQSVPSPATRSCRRSPSRRASCS